MILTNDGIQADNGAEKAAEREECRAKRHREDCEERERQLRRLSRLGNALENNPGKIRAADLNGYDLLATRVAYTCRRQPVWIFTDRELLYCRPGVKEVTIALRVPSGAVTAKQDGGLLVEYGCGDVWARLESDVVVVKIESNDDYDDVYFEGISEFEWTALEAIDTDGDS